MLRRRCSSYSPEAHARTIVALIDTLGLGECGLVGHLQQELAAMGVSWKIVPKAGHSMGIQNPEGLGQAVAEAITASWPG